MSSLEGMLKGICNVERLFVICFLKNVRLICIFLQLSTFEVCSPLQQTHFQSPSFCEFTLSSWFKQQLPEASVFQHHEMEDLLNILKAYIMFITKLEIIVSKEEKWSNSQIMLLISPTTIIFNVCLLPWFLRLVKVIYGMKTGLASNISFVPSNESRMRKWIRKHFVNPKALYRCELLLLISLFVYPFI